MNITFILLLNFICMVVLAFARYDKLKNADRKVIEVYRGFMRVVVCFTVICVLLRITDGINIGTLNPHTANAVIACLIPMCVNLFTREMLVTNSMEGLKENRMFLNIIFYSSMLFVIIELGKGVSVI